MANVKFKRKMSASNPHSYVAQLGLTTATPSLDQSMCTTCTVIILLCTSITMIIVFSMMYYTVYYITVFVYGCIILFHYGVALIRFVKNSDGNEWFFDFQMLLCFLHNLTTGILIFYEATDMESYTAAASYCLLSIIIPLPLICLKLYGKAVNQNIEETNYSLSSQAQPKRGSLATKTKDSSKTSVTTSTKLLSFIPLRENGIKYGTTLTYIAYTLTYILHPILDFDHFRNEYGALYENVIIKTINTLFLRPFVGIILSQTIFAFLIVLLDPRHQFLTQKIAVLQHLYKTNVFKLFMLFMVFIILFGIDFIRIISRIVEITDSLQRIFGILGIVSDGLWIIIHVFGAITCFVYLNYFYAIQSKRYRRHRQPTQTSFSQFFTVPKAFIIQSSILMLLCALMIAYLYMYHLGSLHFNLVKNDANQLGIAIRMMTTWLFVLIQIVSIYYLISIQHRCNRSFAKNNWRASWLRKVYFQLVTAVNIYDFVFLCVFSMVYYNGNTLNSGDHALVAYSLSFSSLALLWLLLTQLLISYGQWKGIITFKDNINESKTSNDLSRRFSINSSVDCQLTVDNLKNHSRHYNQDKKLSNEYKEIEESKSKQGPNYNQWDHNQIVDWIESLQNGRFKKYGKSLRKNLAEQTITGNVLKELDKNDLYELGVKEFFDKKELLEAIALL